MKIVFLLAISSCFFCNVWAQSPKEVEKRDNTMKVYEKEQAVIKSCIRNGGTPRMFTEQNGCRNVSCTHPQSEKNCVHVVGNPNGANCTPGFCK